MRIPQTLALILLSATPLTFAATTQPSINEEAPPAAITPDQVMAEEAKALITKLGDDDFKTREAATADLRKLGRAALPHIKEATKSDNPEIKARAEKLVAELDPAPATPVAPVQPKGEMRIVGGGMAVRNMRIQVIGGQAAPANPNANAKSVTIVENKDSLEVTITETIDGKPATKTYKAKDAAELKEKHPDAFKAYEEQKNKKPQEVKVPPTIIIDSNRGEGKIDP